MPEKGAKALRPHDLLEKYLRELGRIRSSGGGVQESSYYAAFANLLNDVGRNLRPRVHCILALKDQGAGQPDGGLFTAEQVRRPQIADPLEGQAPSRGAIELKPAREDAWVTAEGKQVSRYWGRYQQVLVSNYRDFVLLGHDLRQRPTKLETYRLADTEEDFWLAVSEAGKTAGTHGEPFIEYLKRVMLAAAPLTSPQDVAWFLASYARDARARLEKTELPGLHAIRSTLEEALGLRFEGGKGDHFFRSTLVQTLFYGMFSAWVLWSRSSSPADDAQFNWHEAAWSLHVPMIRTIFEQLAAPSLVGQLGLEEVLDWTAATLNRVNRTAFFESFEEGEAIQYFYEPFLEAFDPQLRKQLGVWYTPPEIVQYMVARVDEVLKKELDVSDGLADPRVYVLDPCCGTGAYLVEVLKRIHGTLSEKGEDALLALELKKASLERLFGFELLPSPFVIAHMQLGMQLQNWGASLTADERIAVYLTNSLTGWGPTEGAKKQLIFPELEAERDAAEKVKTEAPILVIIGNPPYNAYDGVSPEEEQGLVNSYKHGLISDWKIKKFNLDDLYVRFFRIAERRIVESKESRGVISFISNFSYLGDPSFVVLRQRFLKEFDRLWFDCMNGDSRETGKRTPDGKPDPSVFSTKYNRAGIRLGTAVSLLVRKDAEGAKRPDVQFRDFWGASKRSDLLKSLASPEDSVQYRDVHPDQANRYSFRPLKISAEYLQWPRIVDLCLEPPISGLQEMRGESLIDIDRARLEERMQLYFDKNLDWAKAKKRLPRLTQDAGRFNAKRARQMLADQGFQSEAVRRYSLHPFDNRWCYYSDIRPLWNEPRPDLAAKAWQGNRFLVTRLKAERPNERAPAYATSVLPDYHLLRPNAVAIPLLTVKANSSKSRLQRGFFDSEPSHPVPNISEQIQTYLERIGMPKDSLSAVSIWFHCLAICFSPEYLSDNDDGVREDFPRIPLPASKDVLISSAQLGERVADLLDAEEPVADITAGSIPAWLRSICVISRVGGGGLNPEEGELDVTVGWGHQNARGIVMPGKGKAVLRDYMREEHAALGSAGDYANHLGGKTFDVYLNEVAYYRNIPEKVWDYVIGGYQVLKKWLSYREKPVLGRRLRNDEVREAVGIARRIAALLLLEPDLDSNYQSSRNDALPWGKIKTVRL